LIGRDLEGNGCGLVWSAGLVFAWEKPRNIPVTVAGIISEKTKQNSTHSPATGGHCWSLLVMVAFYQWMSGSDRLRTGRYAIRLVGGRHVELAVLKHWQASGCAQVCCSPRQERIYREANEEASGPLTCTGPIQGPGNGAGTVFTLSQLFEKFAKVRYLNHNRLSIIEVCQEVN